jgi:voltage-gated potassium channel
MKTILLRMGILAGVLVAVLVLGTLGFTVIEHLSPFDAFYLTVATVVTVGYGDIHPTVAAGKILAMGIMFAGVGTFSAIIINSAELLFARSQQETRRLRTNALIGIFFSELGASLLEQLVRSDPLSAELRRETMVSSAWTTVDFYALRKMIAAHTYQLDNTKINFDQLKEALSEKTSFLIRLIESPNLLERESFTELLWATIHLKEELAARSSFQDLPASDISHLVADASRVYKDSAVRWADYMTYLKSTYPYLYSFAVRNNPFHEGHSVIVK